VNKKLLAICASPREGANTENLLTSVTNRFEGAGFAVDVIKPHCAKIGHCLGCMACEKTGKCVQRDDMDGFYPKLLDADVVLFATPVYFYGMPGSAKKFVDRGQALWAMKYRFPDEFAKVSRAGRKGFFLGVGATQGRRLFSGLELTLKYFFDGAGLAMGGSLLFRGFEEAGAFSQDPQHMVRTNEWADSVIGEVC
jgi:multimeric flavodoxin WrbA